MAFRLFWQAHRSLGRKPLTLKRTLQSYRFLHEGKAEFITADAKGLVSNQFLEIMIGDPHEAYVVIDTSVGFAMKAAIEKHIGSDNADQDKLPLTFHHSSRHFAHDALPYPRITIQQDLPHQTSTDTSPATLWLWGATHCITLNGTRDDKLEEFMRESHERLKGAAELLKDR